MSPIRPEVTVVGRRMDGEAHRIRDFLTRVDQPYRWLEADVAQARDLLAARGLAEGDLPLVVEQQRVLPNATAEKLTDAWNESEPPPATDYDVTIVGAGPAGIGGAELAGRQAEGLRSYLALLRAVVGSGRCGDRFQIELAGGYTVRAPVAIAAPGIAWRRLEPMASRTSSTAARTTARAAAGRPSAAATPWSSSAPATLPGRRAPRSRWQSAARTWAGRCRSTSSNASPRTPTSTCASTAR